MKIYNFFEKYSSQKINIFNIIIFDNKNFKF